MLALAAVAALLAGWWSVAPTGFGPADALWCAALAASTVWAGSRSRRWAWIWSAGVVAVFSVGAWGVLVAVAALILGIVGAFAKARWRPLGAVVGALVAIAVQHLPSQGFHGLPSLVAVVALGPLFASAYERSSVAVKRRIRRGMVVGAILVVLAAASVGVSALLARKSLSDAVGDSRTGLSQIRAGHQTDAAVRLGQAAGEFGHASELLGAFWTWPARLIPVLAQQRDALAEAASSGALIARTGSVAADTAPYQQLKASNGQVSIPTVVAMQAPVAATSSALVSAQRTLVRVRSGWLLPPVASPLADFNQQVDDALPQAELASAALADAPGLLGAQGDRNYLILFTNPAESRFLGGFTGSFGILTAHQGKVSFTVGDRISNLFPGSKGRQLAVHGEAEYLHRYGRYDPAHNLQNLTVSPDLPTDAAVTRSLFQQYYGTSLDGVLVVDPYGLAALLKLTGPVLVEGLDVPLTSDNAAHYLIYQQYVTYGNAKDDRKDVLSAAGRATFKALTSRDLPGPADVGKVLGPAVAQGRLLFYPFDTHDQPLFARVGTLGGFAPSTQGDFFSVRSANANPNKIDSLLTRAVDYQASYDPANGMVEATATITVHNGSPPGGLPPYLIGNAKDPANGGDVPLGTNTMNLSFYSPLQLSSASLGGAPVTIESQTEKGAQVYSTSIRVPAGKSAVLVLHLEGTIPTRSTYRLQVLNQPMVNPDTVSVTVASSSPAWQVTSSDGLLANGRQATRSGILTQSQNFSATFGS